MMLKNDAIKVGRNDPCPCGSGKKYKRCCLNSKTPKPVNLEKLYQQKYDIRLKHPKDIEGIRAAGRLVIETLDLMESNLKVGVTTDELNTIAHDFAVKNNAVPAPLNYRGFPKSICTSINEVICHGIPENRALNDGDIINVDITLIYNNYYADASKTYFVGTPGAEAQKIVSVAAESCKAAKTMLMPVNLEKGVGFDFHESPHVPHYGKKGDGIVLVPGMVFTVEPMINLGKADLFVASDNWTAITCDRKLSAQFEQTYLITDEGFESLTPYDL